MKTTCLIAWVFALAAAAGAQPGQPTMVIEGDKAPDLVRLSKVATEVRMAGGLVEVKTTLVFTNTTARQLAGDFYFPLPPGAIVAGYALDINGAMVEGVAVERDRATRAYEELMRRRIDPGLVEIAGGNCFRTRVFPIPAGGSRTISISYICPTGDDTRAPAHTFQLPLVYKDKIGDFALTIRTAGPGRPNVAGGLSDLQFAQHADRFFAQTTQKDATLTKDLVIRQPRTSQPDVAVEKGPDGQYYFAITDWPDLPKLAGPAPKRRLPVRTVILWDASASRGKSGHGVELAFLKNYFDNFKGSVTVDVVLFRAEAEPPRHFDVFDGNVSAITAQLANVDYDGGTNINEALSKSDDGANMYLLFTDGRPTISRELPDKLHTPLYIFSADASPDAAWLTTLARAADGEFFDFNRVTPQAAARSMVEPPSLGWTCELSVRKSDVADLLPDGRSTQAFVGPVRITGRLVGEEASITAFFNHPGAGFGKAIRRDYVVKRSGAGVGNMVRPFFATRMIEPLLANPSKNESEIIRLAKQHGLVTQYTSLLVLESLDQYVQYRVRPPASLADMRREYDRQRPVAPAESAAAPAELIAKRGFYDALAAWGSRVEWWNRQFKHASNFRYRPPRPREYGPEYSTGSTIFGGGSSGGTWGAGGASSATGSAGGSTFGGGGSSTGGGGGGSSTPAEPVRTHATGPAETTDVNSKPEPPPADAVRSAPPAILRSTDLRTLAGTLAPRPEGVTYDDPHPDYLAQLKAARSDQWLETYLRLRRTHDQWPGFFLECGGFFQANNQPALAVQALSNLAEIAPDNPLMLRLLANRLMRLNKFDLAIEVFQRICQLRPADAQSRYDLAMAVARRAEQSADKHRIAAAVADYRRAIGLLAEAATLPESAGLDMICLTDMNGLIAKVGKTLGVEPTGLPVDRRFVQPLEADIRILLTSDVGQLSLVVAEPSGEIAGADHPDTAIGGAISRGGTTCEYMIRKAMHGAYTIQASLTDDKPMQTLGPLRAEATIITNFGRPNEKRETFVLKLNHTGVYEVSRVVF